MSRKYFGNDLILGTTANGKRLRWTAEMRRLHMYVSGVTGSGKSRFLQSLLRQDLDAHARTRQGLLLLDPHGEFYDAVVMYLAERHPRGLAVGDNSLKNKGGRHGC